MAKYRRKGEVVDGFHVPKGVVTHYDGSSNAMGDKERCWVVIRPCGMAEAMTRERFEREYERVEEDKDCPKYEPKRHRCPHDDAYWGKSAEKPKPLTLADLKPGDVFKWAEDWMSKWPVQLLSPWGSGLSGMLYAEHIGVYYAGNRAASVTLLSHQNLTRKQLLWIDAKPSEHKALEDSIKDKWLPRTKGEPRSTGRCALCMVFVARGCDDCIIAKADEGCNGCPTAPWQRWFDGVTLEASGCSNWVPANEREYIVTRDMLLSLSDFLPNIHPLRVACEATPIEWPGKGEGKEE